VVSVLACGPIGPGFDSRLGVKATTLKAKAKAKDLASQAKAKAKDLASKANVNMVRCSVKTYKTQTFIAGLVMTSFILIARFSKLVIKLTVS